jgi:hypothetical protein
MESSLKEKIEDFIKNWYWDEAGKIKAFEIGKVCFAFMAFLEEKLSQKTVRIHIENLFWIGIFENDYGLNEAFDIEDLTSADLNIDYFERKVSDSEYAMKSYKATCRKLEKFIESGTYKSYLEEIEKLLKYEINN